MQHIKRFKVRHYQDAPSEIQTLSEEQLIQWAQEDVTNAKHEGPAPTTLEEAILILNEIGDLEIWGPNDREER